MYMKKIAVAACCVLCVSPLFSQNVKSSQAKAAIEAKKNGKSGKKAEKIANPIVFNEDFDKGEELFSLNEPKAAIPFFEKAIEAENVNPAVYIYLGVAYYQTGDYNKSLAVCVKGLARDDTDHKVLAYNAGNSCYAMGNYMRADASYAIAIKEDEKYAPAVLNRANAQLKLDHLEDAKNNYIKYLELDPETPQRERIELLIKLLEQEIELRAKQRPELINPDEFVENEKMETGEIPELVTVEIPVYEEERPDVPEKVVFDSVAPAIPVDQLEIVKPNEVLAEEKAPELPVEVVAAEEVHSEKVKERPPVIEEPVLTKVEEKPHQERIVGGAPELPVEAEKTAASPVVAEKFSMDELPAVEEKTDADKLASEKSPTERFSAESAPEIPEEMYGTRGTPNCA
ncbi:MAG: hypothetical protein KBT11_05415 [Treponema sp.]|nr:hypothetical protein [Candidatus Treponema equifaecale]